MKNRLDKALKKSWIRWGMIPTLFIIWIVLTIHHIITFDTSFSIWSYNHSNSNFDRITFSKLYKGDIVSGKFKAEDNNLGIVSVRFQTFVRPPYKLEDKFRFRLKEVGSKNWYYENTYRSGFMYELPFLPFGFPQISNSKGHTYYFEIESLAGNDINAVAISKRQPILVSKYKYSKGELLQNKKVLVGFLEKKFVNAIQNQDIWYSSLIYLLAPMLYLISVTAFSKKVAKFFSPFSEAQRAFFKTNIGKAIEPVFLVVKNLLLLKFDFIVLGVIFFDIVYFQLMNDVIYLVLVLIWGILSEVYARKSKNTILIAAFFLVLSGGLYAFQNEPAGEKAAIWAFIFFFIGLLQSISEYKRETKSSPKKA